MYLTKDNVSVGAVVIWDIVKGQSVKSISDGHQSQPLAYVRFGASHNIVISIDVTGVVNTISLTKMLLVIVIDCRCLLQGVGAVVALDLLPKTHLHGKHGAALRLAAAALAHPLDAYNLIAIATTKRVFVNLFHRCSY